MATLRVMHLAVLVIVHSIFKLRLQTGGLWSLSAANTECNLNDAGRRYMQFRHENLRDVRTRMGFCRLRLCTPLARKGRMTFVSIWVPSGVCGNQHMNMSKGATWTARGTCLVSSRHMEQARDWSSRSEPAVEFSQRMASNFCIALSTSSMTLTVDCVCALLRRRNVKRASML